MKAIGTERILELFKHTILAAAPLDHLKDEKQRGKILLFSEVQKASLETANPFEVWILIRRITK